MLLGIPIELEDDVKVKRNCGAPPVKLPKFVTIF
jgi:hypothetical protein